MCCAVDLTRPCELSSRYTPTLKYVVGQSRRAVCRQGALSAKGISRFASTASTFLSCRRHRLDTTARGKWSTRYKTPTAQLSVLWLLRHKNLYGTLDSPHILLISYTEYLCKLRPNSPYIYNSKYIYCVTPCHMYGCMYVFIIRYIEYRVLWGHKSSCLLDHHHDFTVTLRYRANYILKLPVIALQFTFFWFSFGQENRMMK